ncbi:hypothetical protein [Streptomyces sp. NPDC056723]|uniref:hypothetical protein n=1 Tax=Streptomyces sp. NPDC056723 TaxID=3345925 RepID=UPI00367C2DA0
MPRSGTDSESVLHFGLSPLCRGFLDGFAVQARQDPVRQELVIIAGELGLVPPSR